MYVLESRESLLVVERRVEIERVMGKLAKRKAQLGSLISEGLDAQCLTDARTRNDGMHGILGALWSRFLQLPVLNQLEALQADAFQGMHWQSLMQAHPFAGLFRHE